MGCSTGVFTQEAFTFSLQTSVWEFLSFPPASPGDLTSCGAYYSSFFARSSHTNAP